VAATSPAAPTSLGATTVSALYLNLTWTDNASNESDFVLERATDSGFTQNLLLTSLGMDITSYSDTNVSPSTTYYYRLRAHNNVGYSAYSNLVNDTTLANTSIFTANQDLGSPSPAGSYSETSGAYTVNGGGTDINGTSDKFQFVYKSLTGDGSIIARVINVEDTDSWAKAGVMFRNALTTGSANAFVALTPDNGATFQWRSNANGSTNASTFIGAAIPYWVRLTRSGNSFTGYRSSDGVTWTQIGSTVTLSMSSTVYVGLAVTSHASDTLNTSLFSHVSVTAPPLPDADFDGDGDVNGNDFLAWQRGYGIQAPNATNANGDADDDRDVDGDDLGIWKGQFGTGGAAATAALLSESMETAPAAIAELVAVESPSAAHALQPLSAALVDLAMAWDLASSRPQLKFHPAPAALAEKVHSDRLPPAVSRAPSMPWHASSNTAKHLEFGRVDDIFDFEGDDSAYEQLLDWLVAEDESVRSAMRTFMFAR
jgi:regulation of enolase protein 1 (concanavalin A-like superfamily)